MAVLILLYLPILFFTMTTAEAPDGSVDQFPRFKLAKPGESVTMKCKITVRKGEIVGTHLRRNPPSPEDLCYFKSIDSIHVGDLYKDRLECNKTIGDESTITFQFRNLQISDTDFYYCITGIKHIRVAEFSGRGTLLIVSEPDNQTCAANCVEEKFCQVDYLKDPVMIALIIFVIVLGICGLVLLISYGRKHYHCEQSQRKRAPNSVYEDMNLVRTQSMVR
ncbi:uncharacterized protein LOC132380317 [Hypanus sabinus]|uniref:uncharacterized protein LOC132380317 n=1 Tax=Hypanus sabinus TaxID=79690 RepID=UPI0028C48E0C|nr:uncharacterized protein LOC132380317 [Hypanus sabinus]